MKKKALVLLMALVLSVTAAIGGSYAWFTSSDSVDNEFELANVGAKITEVFEPNTVVPGLEIKKKVAIANDKSNVNILVRVKMSEVLKMLVTGTDGAPRITWNTTVGATAPNEVLKASDAFITTISGSAEWKTITLTGKSTLTIYRKTATVDASTNKYTYFAFDTATKQLAQIVNPVLNAAGTALTSATVTYAVNTWDTTKGPTDVTIANGGVVTGAGTIHQYMQFVYGTGVVADPVGTVSGATNWFYSNGYFYYNKVLAPGAETTPLITGVNFLGTLPNSFQGAKFTLTPNLEAIQATKAAVSSTVGGWGITDATVLARLQALCAN